MSVSQPEKPFQETDRERLIRSLRGKYAHVKTSSDDFSKRKLVEIQREAGWETTDE